MFRWGVLFFSVTICWNVKADINLTSLISNGMERWQTKIFSGHSTYTLNDDKGRLALKAISHSSASGLVLEQRIDLVKTPYLNWSWLIKNKLLALDERSKSGDDFVARIYVVIDGGFMLWRTKSLNYVWSSNQDKGLIWDNPFAGSRVKMMSVQGKASNTGQWFEEKRNVYQDLIAAFGDKGRVEENQDAYRYIDVIAIMTDTDNSGKEAESYYGDMVFSVQ